MSSPLSLKEYRCACGKLLFKGLLTISTLEIKCKRCGAMRTFKDELSGQRSFTVVIDGEGRVVDACDGITILEYGGQSVIGKSFSDILPLARDALYEEISSDGTYRIRKNTLLLRDRRVLLESHIVPVGENVDVSRVFNIIK